MRVLHTSDIHGKYKRILGCDQDFDVWLDTGDFLETYGRRRSTGNMIDPHSEIVYQSKWVSWTDLANRFTQWLGGRPAIICGGNHDFLDWGDKLKIAGANVYKVNPAGFELLGTKWSGFREIPVIEREWMGEVDDFSSLVDETFESSPDSLVTHAPPNSILDKQGYGISYLTSKLMYSEHKIRAHFFGHNHLMGGKSTTIVDTTFYNGACNVMVHDI